MKIEKIPKNSINKLESLGVGVVYLFGSQAQGTAHFDSDIDIGVVFLDPTPLFDYKKYSKIYQILFEFFSDLFRSGMRIIDIVPLQIAPYSLRFEAIVPGKILYQSSPIFRADFEEQVIKMYFDFRPMVEMYHRATLERIK